MKKSLPLFLLFILVFAGCDPEDIFKTPTVTTAAITSIAQSGAKGGGEVTSEGHTPVSARGLCWSTVPGPTIDDNKTSNGTGAGVFSSDITGLQPKTKYFVRAYATNESGTTYGSEVEFTTTVRLTGLTISAVNNTAAKGLVISLKAEGKYADNTTKDVTGSVVWSSTNSSIAAYSGAEEPGTFIAKGEGETKVIATLEDQVAEFTVTVTPAELVSIKIQAEKDKMIPGESQAASVIGTYTDDSTAEIPLDDITWSSSDGERVGMDWDVSTFYLIANSFGNATITAEVGTLTATLEITVAISIGQEYAGGIVFYVDETGEHGLVAAPSDQSDGIVFWIGTWHYEEGLSNTPDESVGAGESNTATQVGLQGDGTYAAKLCSDLVLNDHDDWFLPSSGELQLMCQNLYQDGIGDLSDNMYWSSTDADRIRNANFIQFSDQCGIRNDLGRDQLFRVRAIRKF